MRIEAYAHAQRWLRVCPEWLAQALGLRQVMHRRRCSDAQAVMRRRRRAFDSTPAATAPVCAEPLRRVLGSGDVP